MSAFGIELDVGIAVGSVAQGMVVEAYGFGAAFGLTAAIPLLTLAVYWIGSNKRSH
jgi:predicted MFS family arabinose efflux permease